MSDEDSTSYKALDIWVLMNPLLSRLLKIGSVVGCIVSEGGWGIRTTVSAEMLGYGQTGGGGGC